MAFEVPPPPPRFLHDGANALTPAEARTLEERLVRLRREAGLEIGIAILPALDGEALEQATLAIAEAWRPGTAERDDGILIALFLAERKLRIEVGYGLEGAIPDALAGRILRNIMVPALRAGRPADALGQAIEALAAAARGETVAPPPARRRVDPVLVFVLLTLAASALPLWTAGLRRRSRHPRTLRRGRHIPWWIPDISIGGGSGSRGGWSGGGGSFGGGSFGGGGASGGW